ncbi:MAG: TonB-dependent receptor [Gammaproteobacteria bacterium]|nr:TonB-dependent receptor [Gammaproteobacteria bacterium]
MKKRDNFRISALSAAIASALVSGPAYTQDKLLEEVIVTATRRAESIQDIPINITALSSDIIQRQRLSDLSDISRWVPGMTVVDQGPRSGNILTVRGLNVDSLSAPEALTNSGGDTMGIYVGEIPMYIDLKLNDMDRVETLIGPQGTLYGAGTLAGAVRYIPNKPDPEQTLVEVRGDSYDLSHSSELGYEGGTTVNIPIIENRLALRASLDYFSDPGFIDYDYLVREPGVSNPQPDFDNPQDVRDNLRRKADANTEETWSSRVALRYVGDAFDGTLSYYSQDMDIGGRQINSRDAFGTGKYVSALRYEEPNKRKNDLTALELVFDLGFAELTSATGYTEYNENGQRDQTDLLLTFEYGYEEFPSFSAFTREDVDDERFNQEIRLVSTGDGPLNWITGVFYNDFKRRSISQEFTPGFDQFAVDNFGGAQLRPDALEYYQTDDIKLTEKAVYGEVGYQLTDAWQVTLGARYFRFEEDDTTGFDLPLFYTVFDGRVPPDLIDPVYQSADTNDDDAIFKFNTSYHFSEDVLGYLTVSEGYRLGGINAVPPCVDLNSGEQNVCALPNEINIKPDKTVNYEVGVHSEIGDNILLNGSVYYIDWKDIQMANVTENGAVPIVTNASKARSTGIELSGQWYITEDLSVMGTYAYIDAQLTEDAPGVLDGEDAYNGDRLPGTPEHQGSLAVNYGTGLADGSQLDFDWSIVGNSNVLTKVGERNYGEKLSGYTLSNVSATWSRDAWRVSLYADNVFDKYYETGVRQTPAISTR